MQLATILPPEAVIPRLSARDKKQALKRLSAQAAALTGLSERDIYGTLAEREHLGCTGLGNGVAIPHGRFEALGSLKAVFARLEKPVDFGAADGKPVDLVFLLLTPASANTEHIKAMAILSRFLRDKSLCAELRRTEDAVALHALLVAEA